MKKTGLTILMTALISTALFADGNPTTCKQKIAYMAKQEFSSDFANVKQVQWNRDEQYSEASFIQNNKPMHAFYDWNGGLVGTTQTVLVTDLPTTARKAIAKHFKEYAIDKVILYNDNQDNLSDLYPLVPWESGINYFVSLKKESLPGEIILKVNPNGDVSFFEDMR